MEAKDKFQIWGIVELFGHNKIAGELTEQNIAGANMLRVDVPETESNPSFTRFLNHAAIYAINPTDKETATYIAKNLNNKPIDSWDIKQFQDKALLLKVNNDKSNDDSFNFEDNDFPM
jgi:hypothetical protein